jgi:hypothetical protein
MPPCERWVEGTATLISYRVIAEMPRRGPRPTAFVSARVVVQGDGIEPTAAELRLHTTVDGTLRLGRTFDVLFDPDEPTRVMAQDGGRELRRTIRARKAPTVKRRIITPPPDADAAIGGVMPTAFGEP